MTVHNLSYPYLENIRQKPFVSTRKEVSMKPSEYSKIIKPFLLAALTVIFAAGAIAPNVLNIPLAWQPWLFITSIFWFVAYFTGTFNS
ncbi:MAG: hypothetical protein IPM31_05830 [Anaerolineae bacterium]|nr:hypothetical protein [Anaerolineae bacterium]MBL8105617.1 hypothetical protein [Anaerolineales bacterium]MCC7190641.1 hypothetical protein [Anaerolineales bacterium]